MSLEGMYQNLKENYLETGEPIEDNQFFSTLMEELGVNNEVLYTWGLPELPNRERTLILDLDGVITKRTGNHIPTHEEASAFANLTQVMTDRQIMPVVCTNRGAANLTHIAYDLKMGYNKDKQRNGGLVVCENDAFIWDPISNRQVLMPWYADIFPQVGMVRNIVSRSLNIPLFPASLKNNMQFSPGFGGTLKTEVEFPIDEDEIEQEGWDQHLDRIKVVARDLNHNLSEEGLDEHWEALAGKCLEVRPKSMSKQRGMMLTMLANRINPTREKTAFIADEKRDVIGADIIFPWGGTIMCVGDNAAEIFRDHVRQLAGKNSARAMIAPQGTAYSTSALWLVENWE